MQEMCGSALIASPEREDTHLSQIPDRLGDTLTVVFVHPPLFLHISPDSAGFSFQSNSSCSFGTYSIHPPT